MEIYEVAAGIAEASAEFGREANVGFDATGMEADAIKLTIEKVAESVQGTPTRLLGVRVGADIFALLGGASSWFPNARMEGNIPVVVVDDFGKMEFAFKPR